jgi:hypothetical protein
VRLRQPHEAQHRLQGRRDIRRPERVPIILPAPSPAEATPADHRKTDSSESPAIHAARVRDSQPVLQAAAPEAKGRELQGQHLLHVGKEYHVRGQIRQSAEFEALPVAAGQQGAAPEEPHLRVLRRCQGAGPRQGGSSHPHFQKETSQVFQIAEPEKREEERTAAVQTARKPVSLQADFGGNPPKTAVKVDK